LKKNGKIFENSKKNANNKNIAKNLKSKIGKRKRLLLINIFFKIILIIPTLNT
jgi:uncharacterized membrane protein YvbJ